MIRETLNPVIETNMYIKSNICLICDFFFYKNFKNHFFDIIVLYNKRILYGLESSLCSRNDNPANY